MNKVILSVLCMFPFLLSAQGNFEIKGKVGNWNAPVKAYLVYNTEAGMVTDSAKVNDGVFSFKGAISEPTAITLALDLKGIGLAQLNNSNADVLGLYLSNETIAVSSNDSLKKAIITGSAINDALATYNNFIRTHAAKSMALQAEIASTPFEKQTDSVFQQELNKKKIAAHEEAAVALKQYVKQNPSSFFSLVAFSNLVKIRSNEETIDSLDKLYNGLLPGLRNTWQGREIAKKLQTMLGASAPVFTQPDTSGKQISLSDFKDKYILLDFWASWCMPCRMENPNVVQAYKKYHSKGLEILGISLDDASRKNAWLEAIKKDGLVWAQVSDLKGWQNKAAQLYVVESIPQNFLIDPVGKIIATNLRGVDLDKKLEELLGKQK